jgi:transcriptional regulator with XRE-family HTH domain
MTEKDMTGAPASAIRKEFAKRLQDALIEKGWRQSDLARAMGVGRDNISKYINARVLPLPPALESMAKALGKEPQDLLRTRARRAVDDENAAFHVRELEDGRVWLRVNQASDWPTAIKIAALLEGVALQA